MAHGHKAKSEPKPGSRTKLNFLLSGESSNLQPGHPEYTRVLRKHAAQHVRDIRALWPTLCGRWTRREWNAQARTAGEHYMQNMIKFHLANKP